MNTIGIVIFETSTLQETFIIKLMKIIFVDITILSSTTSLYG